MTDTELAPGLAQRPRAPTVVIESPRWWAPLRLRDLWDYRDLFYFLAWRDLKVRYKQTALGAAWAILQPLLTMVVFTIVFGGFIGVSSDGSAYPVFSYVGLLPATYFANAMSQAGLSLVSSANLITKIYFPRLIIPLASVIALLVDLGIASLVLVGLMFYYQLTPPVQILALPLFVLLATLSAIGAGLWLSALSVEYRDVKYVIPFLTQFWLFISPVAYPLSKVPAKWRTVYALNPMVGVVEGFRWALLGNVQWPAQSLAIGTLVIAFVLVTGLFYFRRMERTFADVI